MSRGRRWYFEKKDEMAFTLRVYRDNIEKLDYIASDYDRSRNNVINQAIRMYISHYEEQHGKITLEDLRAMAEVNAEGKK